MHKVTIWFYYFSCSSLDVRDSNLQDKLDLSDSFEMKEFISLYTYSIYDKKNHISRGFFCRSSKKKSSAIFYAMNQCCVYCLIPNCPANQFFPSINIYSIFHKKKIYLTFVTFYINFVSQIKLLVLIIIAFSAWKGIMTKKEIKRWRVFSSPW